MRGFRPTRSSRSAREGQWLRRGRRDETGSALAIVLAITVVLVSTMTLGAAVIARSLNQTLLYQRTSDAQYAAIGGLDASVAFIRNDDDFHTLPCTEAGSETLPGALSSYSVTLSYSLNGSPLTCSGSTLGGIAWPSAATLVSTGTAAGAPVATMEEKVKIIPGTTAQALGYAILTEDDLSLYNGDSLDQTPGNGTPDIYSGGTLTCPNGVASMGNATTFEPVTLTGTCNYTGSLVSTGAVTMQNSTSVSGSVTSYDGSISLSGTATIGQNAMETNGTISVASATIEGNADASGSISITGGGHIMGSQTADDSSISTLPPPTPLPWPTLDPSLATSYSVWSAEGWIVKAIGGNGQTSCSSYFKSLNNGATDPFMNDIQTAPGPTVIYAPSCDVSYSNTHVFNLNSDIVLQVHSLTLSNFNTFQSTSNTVHNFEVLADLGGGGTCPINRAPSGYTSITVQNAADFLPSVITFFYTPDSVSYANAPSMYGEIWACSGFVANNAFILEFAPPGPNSLPFSGGLLPTVDVLTKYLLKI